jgi:hypothetical protein
MAYSHSHTASRMSSCFHRSRRAGIAPRKKTIRSRFMLMAATSALALAQAALGQTSGSIVAWGDNSLGQCNVPPPNSGFVAVAAAYMHSLGLKSDGSIVAWGSNNTGQSNVPEPNTDFVAVAAGSYHSLGLRAGTGCGRAVAVAPDGVAAAAQNHLDTASRQAPSPIRARFEVADRLNV